VDRFTGRNPLLETRQVTVPKAWY